MNDHLSVGLALTSATALIALLVAGLVLTLFARRNQALDEIRQIRDALSGFCPRAELLSLEARFDQRLRDEHAELVVLRETVARREDITALGDRIDGLHHSYSQFRQTVYGFILDTTRVIAAQSPNAEVRASLSALAAAVSRQPSGPPS